MAEQIDKYLSPNAIAARLDMTPGAVCRWCQTGVLPAVWLGRWRVHPDDLARFLEDRRKGRVKAADLEPAE